MLSNVKKQCRKGKFQCSRRNLSKDFSKYRFAEPDRNRVIEEYFISLNTPLALSCLILFKAGEFKQLVEKEIDPLDYNDAYHFRDDYAAVCFLKKNKFLKTGIDLREKALESFKSSELQCARTNKRFRNLSLDPSFKGSNVWLLNATIRKIDRILGDLSVEDIFDCGSWGPGVTLSIKGDNVSSSRKFREESGITKQAYRLVGHLMNEAYPSWIGPTFNFDIKQGNKVITVPKNAKTDRTIAVEPGLNSWFQLSIGKAIRRRLWRAGFNLNSDKKNQSAAKSGSIDNSLATVDFSAASDTISYDLVREILPPRWFTVLDSLRSSCFELDGEITPYQKFSAMGNGFTFELESLIFVSAALAVCEQLDLDTSSVSVFGDDIIIPSEAYAAYRDFCIFLGFTVNNQKSFFSGCFRESCGSYFYLGLDVKPLFLKEDIKHAKAVYRLVNNVRWHAHRRNSFSGCDHRLLPVWKSLFRRLPIALRALGPVDSGDSCIHVNFDEGTPMIARDQWCGYLHPGFLTVPLQRHDDHNSLLIATLWRPSSTSDHGNQVTLRAKTKVIFRKNNFASQWYNFGPWF